MRLPHTLTVLLVAWFSVSCASSGAPRPAAAAAGPSDRGRFLEMFARGYFPGRSGQIFLVPREGDVITDRDEHYNFMHGSPWGYDVRIPLLFAGAPFVQPGTWPDEVVQQDVAPTIGALIGAPHVPTMTGRVLRQALANEAGRPKVVLLLVLDAMRADYFDRYAELMPELTAIRRAGAWFSGARVNSLPTVTSIGHATIGTGTDPRIHGLASNNLFNRATGKAQNAYDGLDPRELMALTLADAWNLATDGRAVIIGQGGAMRATAGLVGRGACLVGARPVIAASYATRDAGWETNPTCYRMPDYLKAINGRPMWEAAGGVWMGHKIADPTAFRHTSLFQRLEGDALVAVVEHEPLGADDITDLVMVNMKGPDYTAHSFGPDSEELKATLGELDRQVARVWKAIEQKAGANQSVLVVTADHGMPSDPPPGRRHYGDEVAALLNKRFDPSGALIKSYADDTANSQIYMDTVRLRALGFSLDDVASFLQTLEFIAAAFTEDEVREAGRLLPRP